MHHGPRVSAERRRALASAFGAGAEEYDGVRPDYPRAIADACLEGLFPGERLRIADIGAGTGIFTEQLAAAAAGQGREAAVVAVDVSEDMLARARERGLHAVLGSGERTGLESQAFELVSYAQAWHWADPDAAGREAARLVRPKGRLALVWNQLDVEVPWVKRLSRIMRSGDIFYAPERPPRPGGRWRSPELSVERFSQPLTPAQAVELAKTRSSYRTAPPEQRRRIEEQTLAYLTEELGLPADEPFELPYLSFAWTFVRSSRI